MSSLSELIDKTHQGDVRELVRQFPDSSIDLVVTSPPYFKLRSYTDNIDPREIGREHLLEDYIKNLVGVFKLTLPKIKSTGSIWVNIDDTYKFGSPLMVPEKFCLAMIDLGLKLHNKVIWYKPDPQSESVTGRFTRKYEVFYWFTLTKEYYFDRDATNIPVRLNTVQRMYYDFHDSKQLQSSRMRGMVGNMAHKIADLLEEGTDCGDVWIIPTNKDKVPHKAPYPQQLVARPIIACCPESGVVFDPFMGSGRTAIAANRLARHFIGTELSPEYAKLCNDEVAKELNTFGQNIFLSEEADDFLGSSFLHKEVQFDLGLQGGENALATDSGGLVVADPSGGGGTGAGGSPSGQSEPTADQPTAVPANGGLNSEGR